MLGIAMTVFVLGFLLGFVTYFGVRTGYKEWMKVLEEEKSTKKEPLAYTGKVD